MAHRSNIDTDFASPNFPNCQFFCALTKIIPLVLLLFSLNHFWESKPFPFGRRSWFLPFCGLAFQARPSHGDDLRRLIVYLRLSGCIWSAASLKGTIGHNLPRLTTSTSPMCVLPKVRIATQIRLQTPPRNSSGAEMFSDAPTKNSFSWPSFAPPANVFNFPTLIPNTRDFGSHHSPSIHVFWDMFFPGLDLCPQISFYQTRVVCLLRSVRDSWDKTLFQNLLKK